MTKKNLLKNVMLFIFFLASCASGNNASKKGKVTLYIDCPMASFAEVIKQELPNFVLQNDLNIEIEIVVTDGGEGTYYLPDIEYGYCGSFDRASTIKNYMNVDEKYDRMIQEKIDESILDSNRINNKLYWYPMFIQNQQVLYYDSSILTKDDVSSWDKLLNKCKESNYKVLNTNGQGEVYASAFFGNNVQTEFVFNATGKLTNVNDNFNSSEGLIVAKSLSKFFSNDYIETKSSAPSTNDGYAAWFGGSWDYYSNRFNKQTIASELFGDNLSIAVIPSLSIDNVDLTWSSPLESYGIKLRDSKEIVKNKVIQFVASQIASKEFIEKLLENENDKHFIPANKELRQQVISDVLSFSQIDINSINLSNFPYNYYGDVNYYLISKIRQDNGQLNEEVLMNALNDYHSYITGLINK